jgi:succinate-semialdehyde dehydrogenase/glutarate-semialdehyde dehydrogenase
MPQYPKIQLYIGGTWKSADGEPVINPSDESVIGTVPHASRADLDDALNAAAEGFKVWSRMSPLERSQIICKATALMRERIEDIAYAMTLEQGKPLQQSRLEVVRGSGIIEWDAEEGRRVYGRIIPYDAGMRVSTMRQPIGVVAGFSPWNFPVTSPARKIGGALAAGCSMVLKASEETPAGAMQLVKAFEDAGLPKGVLNLVFGVPSQISETLIADPRVRLVTFTGSVPVGKKLAAMASEHMKPSLMELGGHGPVIVCDDVDPVIAAKAAVIGKSRNSGQVCTAPTRFFVEEAIYDRFVSAFAQGAAAIKQGDGLDASVQMGPVANERRLATMEAMVADARAKGAKVVAGGNRIGTRGYHYPLTVIADCTDEMRAMTEEPFGPLALIAPVKNLDEAIAKANALPYGLTGYAFTESARKVEQISNQIEVGNLSINHFTGSIAEAPFGGVKDSGFGREGGVEGLYNYTVVKSIMHLTT